MPRLPQPFTLFPFTTLFRSRIYTLFLKFRPDKEQRTNRSSIGNRIRQERQHASYAVQRATKRRANQGGNTECHLVLRAGDRKSTRLNSSHANISYAVFCLK